MSSANGAMPAAAARARTPGPMADDHEGQVEQVEVRPLADLNQGLIVGHEHPVGTMPGRTRGRMVILEQPPRRRQASGPDELVSGKAPDQPFQLEHAERGQDLGGGGSAPLRMSVLCLIEDKPRDPLRDLMKQRSGVEVEVPARGETLSLE